MCKEFSSSLEEVSSREKIVNEPVKFGLGAPRPVESDNVVIEDVDELPRVDLAPYIAMHTLMLRGCVKSGFINVKEITPTLARKRSHSCCQFATGVESSSGIDWERAVHTLMYKQPCMKERVSTSVRRSPSHDTVSMNGGEAVSPSSTASTRVGGSTAFDEVTDGLLKVMRLPFYSEGPIRAAGSRFHEFYTCKVCAFYWTPKGCLNGRSCSFCHEFHGMTKKSKGKRLIRCRTPILSPEAATGVPCFFF